jgi:hypothetical protein
MNCPGFDGGMNRPGFLEGSGAIQKKKLVVLCALGAFVLNRPAASTPDIEIDRLG